MREILIIEKDEEAARRTAEFLNSQGIETALDEEMIRVTSAVMDPELGERVRTALRVRKRYMPDETIREDIVARGIRIDPMHRRVWVRHREKKLTHKEYELLLYLMEHPDQPFTKEQLYRAVWKDEAVGGLATVTVHIKKLRMKVEERPAYPSIIVTEWGVGYMFCSEDRES